MLIDSNILIYSLTDNSPKRQAAQDFLQSQKKLVFAQQNIFEALRILTHRKFSNPFSANQAIEAIEEIAKHGKIIFPSFETSDLALKLIQKYQVKGSEIFDAYFVATALSNEINKIATDNIKHLDKYQEIVVINPFA